MALQDELLAAVTAGAAMPWADLAAAVQDPSNVGKDALALEEIVGALPLPPLDAIAAELAIAGLAWIIRQAQAGAIRPGASGEGQTTPPPHGWQGR